jgi:putative Mn2+ efflux pump MntP
LVKIIALVLPLTLETFAVSAALAVGGPSTGWRTRRWLLFAASEAGMPLVGLAIGFTVGLLRLPVVPVIAVIAVQAFAVSWLGMRFGVRVGERIREGAERLSGVALALLATGLLIAAAAG